MRAKGMKSLTFILPQEANKPFVAPSAPAAGLTGGPVRNPIQGRMSDREVDQQLVERAQRGDKQAFEMLVLKYQRKLERLLSRVIRDPAEIEDVAQEAFIKAYRALPNFRGDSAFYT
jgi:sigma-70-like protein